MGILDTITGAAGSANGGGLLDGIKDIMNQQGGLGGLVEKFKASGLGDKIESWISPGANQPVTPQQVTQVVGNDQLQQIATKTGLPVQEVTSQIATNLPSIVDKLTPDGKVPEGNLLEKGMEMLKGIL